MIDLKHSGQRAALKRRMDECRTALEPYCTTRQEAIEEYVGTYYGQNRDRQRIRPVVVNLLNQAIETYVLLLVASRPRVMVETPFNELVPASYRLQSGINNCIKDIRLDRTLRDIVLDAIFRVGIAKIYYADAGMVELAEDEWIDPRRPYVERVGLTDFGYDLTKKRWGQVRFAWDQYEVSFRKLRDDDRFDQQLVAELGPDSRHGGEDGAEDPRDLSGGREARAALDDRVTLMDVWLPENNSVATIPRFGTDKPLAERPWTGPRGGPYRLLGFGDVPDNIMPLSLVDQLKPQHDLFNALMRKLSRQARRQKTNPVYEASAAGDAKNLKKASDGDWTKVGNRDRIGTLEQGGINRENLAFALHTMGLFDRAAGNLESLAGLGPTAGTLGQEELIAGQASRKAVKMRERVVEFTSDVCEALAHYIWNDEANVIHGEVRVGSLRLDHRWSAEHRDGDFLQYNFSVDPYSMAYEPPAAKLAKLERNLGMIAPFGDQLQAAGGSIDVQELCEQLAELSDSPRFKRIVTFATPGIFHRPGPAGDKSKQASHTVRENIRRSVSTGGTQRDRNNTMAELMLTDRPQAGRSQVAGVTGV